MRCDGGDRGREKRTAVAAAAGMNVGTHGKDHLLGDRGLRHARCWRLRRRLDDSVQVGRRICEGQRDMQCRARIRVNRCFGPTLDLTPGGLSGRKAHDRHCTPMQFTCCYRSPHCLLALLRWMRTYIPKKRHAFQETMGQGTTSSGASFVSPGSALQGDASGGFGRRRAG